MTDDIFHGKVDINFTENDTCPQVFFLKNQITCFLLKFEIQCTNFFAFKSCIIEHYVSIKTNISPYTVYLNFQLRSYLFFPHSEYKTKKHLVFKSKKSDSSSQSGKSFVSVFFYLIKNSCFNHSLALKSEFIRLEMNQTSFF